jgi:thymidylate kinase
MGFLKKVEENYLKLAKEERFVKIDAKKSIKEIVDEAVNYIEELVKSS